MSTHKPLSKEERIIALGTAIGIIRRRVKDGNTQESADMTMKCIEGLAQTVGKEDLDKLKDLVSRGMADGIINVLMEMFTCEKYETLPMDEYEKFMHCHAEADRLPLIISGLAQAYRQKDPVMLRHGLMLADKYVTEEMREAACKTIKESLTKCGCPDCVEQLRLIKEKEEEYEAKEKQKQEDEPADPFQSFAM